jgi:hypothetical protein
MPRKKKVKSKRKQDAIRHNAGIAAWRKAAAEYLRTGSFVHLPRKGSKEHEKMLQRQAALLPVVKIEIAEMIKREREEDCQRRKVTAAKRQREIARLNASEPAHAINTVLPANYDSIDIDEDEEVVPLNSDLEEYTYDSDGDEICSDGEESDWV